MKSIKNLKNEMDYLTGFLTMVESYEEVAALRMRKVKKSILDRRDFMEGLNEAFAHISYAYKVYKSSLKGKEKYTVLNTNGKTVSVLLSSNSGLYGDIIINTFDLFLRETSKIDTDIVIVGKLGKSMYESVQNKKKYEYFEMSDNEINDLSIKKLNEYILEYSNIVVYHGSFESFISQVPAKTEVRVELHKVGDSLLNYDKNFLFEPSIEKIAEYFEKQVASLIFEQIVFESYLSKFASRMVSMDAASDNIEIKIHKTDMAIKKIKHKDINADLNPVIFGGSVWQ